MEFVLISFNKPDVQVRKTLKINFSGHVNNFIINYHSTTNYDLQKSIFTVILVGFHEVLQDFGLKFLP